MNNPRNFLVICLFLLLPNCSSFPENRSVTSDPIVELNLNLLLSWNQSTADTSTATREVIYKFEKNGKKLFYLQSGHGTDKNSKTFAAIDWIYKNNKPDAAIIEGFPSSLGISPPHIVAQMSKGIKGDFYPDGEVSYMVIKANEHNVPFVGGESTIKESVQKVMAAGYSTNDYLNFSFVRVIAQKIRSGELNSKNVEKVYLTYIQDKAKQISYENYMNYNDFKKWYKIGQNKYFFFDRIEDGEAAPIDNGKFLTQKISVLDMFAREEAIATAIETMLNKYNTVFIAYGSSHYRMEHRMLKDYFGEPELIDKF